MKFNIIKYIIDIRVAENEAAQLARANREQKQKILKFIVKLTCRLCLRRWVMIEANEKRRNVRISL